MKITMALLAAEGFVKQELRAIALCMREPMQAHRICAFKRSLFKEQNSTVHDLENRTLHDFTKYKNASIVPIETLRGFL